MLTIKLLSLALDHHVASVSRELREFCIEPRRPKNIHRRCHPRVTQAEVLHETLTREVCRAGTDPAGLPRTTGSEPDARTNGVAV